MAAASAALFAGLRADRKCLGGYPQRCGHT